jgi:UDP-N-acetylglucosamine--N-acetylmuramyl-(pentapeptide) pyrophosphoryl-undecaprenol N-acetylglucosamine transferase
MQTKILKMKKVKAIISGGGTGGHIFPALAIANALKLRFPDIDILFVGAKNRMEMKRVPEAGFNIVGIKISGLQRKLTFKNILKNLTFPYKVLKSLMDAKRILKNFNPDVVVGVGGYASGPTLKMAASLNIPTLIQEQNSFPGITNKLLSQKVKTICVAYQGMEKFFPKDKIVYTGNPVRSDILQMPSKSIDAYNYFNIDPNKKTIAVIGGSLGSLTINRSMLGSLQFFKEADVQVIWQTGDQFYNRIFDKSIELKEVGIKVMPFVKRMDYLYSVADLVISRAGALSISEICGLSKPSILIPSPNVSEDHQTKNAKVLSDANAAILITDKDAPAILGKEALLLIKDENRLNTLGENAGKLSKLNSDELIVDEIVKLIKF